MQTLSAMVVAGISVTRDVGADVDTTVDTVTMDVDATSTDGDDTPDWTASETTTTTATT